MKLVLRVSVEFLHLKAEKICEPRDCPHSSQKQNYYIIIWLCISLQGQVIIIQPLVPLLFVESECCTLKLLKMPQLCTSPDLLKFEHVLEHFGDLLPFIFRIQSYANVHSLGQNWYIVNVRWSKELQRCRSVVGLFITLCLSLFQILLLMQLRVTTCSQLRRRIRFT